MIHKSDCGFIRVIVEPVAAQLEGHVEKDEGSEAVGLVAQSGGHVGHIESSVVDHVEGSGGYG